MAVGSFGFITPPGGKGRLPFVVAAGLLVILVGIGAVSLYGITRAPVQPSAPGALTGGACGGLSVVGNPAVTTLIDPATGNTARVLKIDVTPNCPGTYVQGTFGSAFLRGQTGFDYDSGFTITARASEEELVYPVMNDKISVETLTIVDGNTVAVSGIPRYIGYWTYRGTTETASVACHVAPDNYGPKSVGTKGHLAAIPRITWHADLDISLEDGQSFTKRVSSAETRAEWVRDNATVATATWSGYSFVTGDAPPDAGGVVTIYGVERLGWGLATLAEWQAYQSASDSTCTGVPHYPIQPCYSGYPCTSVPTDNVGKVGKQNAAVGALFASSAALPVPGQFSADGAGYVVTAAPRIQTPVITLYIAGEFLGIVQPSGVPGLSFVGVEPSPYHAGNPGFLNFLASNMGNYSAGFDLAVSCGGAQVSIPVRITLEPRAAPANVRVPFTLSNPGDYNCAGTLTDLTTGAGAKQAQAVFALNVQVCQPGLSRPVGEFRVEACKADGSGWEGVLDCSAIPGSDPVTGAPVLVSSRPVYANGAWSCAAIPEGRAVNVSATPHPVPAFSTAPPATPPPVPGAPAPPPVTGAAPQSTPGFEAVFAVAGLLAVAWLVNRRKR